MFTQVRALSMEVIPYFLLDESYELNPPVYIDTGGARVTQGRLKGGDLHIRIAKLAFHAKESPIRTRDRVFNLVSS